MPTLTIHRHVRQPDSSDGHSDGHAREMHRNGIMAYSMSKSNLNFSVTKVRGFARFFEELYLNLSYAVQPVVEAARYATTVACAGAPHNFVTRAGARRPPDVSKHESSQALGRCSQKS